MPLRVHMLALAMCGTMTALGSSARPGFMAGSSSNTSRPGRVVQHARMRGEVALCHPCMGLHAQEAGRGMLTSPCAGMHTRSPRPCPRRRSAAGPAPQRNSGLTFMCATSAASSMQGPRAALMSTASRFIMSRRSLLIRWRVFSSRLQCSDTTWWGAHRRERPPGPCLSACANAHLHVYAEAMAAADACPHPPTPHPRPQKLTSASRRTSSTVSQRRTATGASPVWRSSSPYLLWGQGAWWRQSGGNLRKRAFTMP